MGELGTAVGDDVALLDAEGSGDVDADAVGTGDATGGDDADGDPATVGCVESDALHEVSKPTAMDATRPRRASTRVM